MNLNKKWICQKHKKRFQITIVIVKCNILCVTQINFENNMIMLCTNGSSLKCMQYIILCMHVKLKCSCSWNFTNLFNKMFTRIYSKSDN